MLVIILALMIVLILVVTIVRGEVSAPSVSLGPAVDAVGFHNFNLRILNLRVSNPNKLIVDVFLTRCRISMCQGLGPKKHDESSEIDQTNHSTN